MEYQYWWLLAAILLFLVEIFTPSFFAASLGIGAFFSAAVAFMGFNLEVQLFVFSMFSLASIFLLRPIIKKHLYNAKDVKTNADAMIGRTGRILQPIGHEMGRIAIDGDEWQCVTEGDAALLPVGAIARVTKRDSIVLTVEPLNN